MTSETSVTLGHCDVCEGPFAVERASANNPHPACRVAKSRRLAREEWTKDEDDEKVSVFCFAIHSCPRHSPERRRYQKRMCSELYDA